jgi:biopolymer transport protein ExbB
MAWYNADWKYRKKITIDNTNVDADLTLFPMLVSATDVLLKTVAEGGHVGNAGGTDIVFTNAAGTKLDHEIELFVAATGQLIAWVEVDAVDHDATTDIYMYYGNAGVADQQAITATWGNSFSMVHHMTGAAHTDLDDATTNNNDVTAKGDNPTFNASGLIAGSSVSFDGSNDNLTVNDSGTLDLAGDFTISFWVLWNDTINQSDLINKNGNYIIRITADGSVSGYYWYDATNRYNISSTFDLTNAATILMHLTNTSNTYQFYVNGAPINTTVASAASARNLGNALLIAGSTTGLFLNGKMDEVRVATDDRPAAWCKAEYYNQSAPTTFCPLGTEEPNASLKDPIQAGIIAFPR